VSVDGADDVDCIHRYVCFLCCRPPSAPRLSAYGAGGVMSVVEEIQGGGRRGILGSGRRVIVEMRDLTP
jgi:hypothetical protein